jgi:hypothetical protein
MILMKKIKYFLLIVVLFITLFINQTNAEIYNVNNFKNIVNSEINIFGTVKEAVTCIPNPLPDATVTAIKIDLLGSENSYTTTTDENGEYELNVEPGKYIVFASKRGYRQIDPVLWYIVNLVSNQEINCSFILRERFFSNYYHINLESNHCKLYQ